MEGLIALFMALVIALLICGAIGLLAWGLLKLVDMIPMVPAFVRQIIRIVVIVFAGLACILVVIQALRGDPFPLTILAPHVGPLP